ncbi:hypothetical protein HXX76_007324 [Chlamydomonas incerta]|uniref:G-patch domain-containing protein n=1 Tax=Chlamydomonas incerta TaxID=51695 RepID=A0A835TBQ2_CHLIN|nr:hypothetical protein HXX76_007324 [Chlamydomonas incerta]|eukprot:KAG2435246.1 hypothetical protein HXX76_007324 [Chlamydomonas incerta]
MGLTGPEQPALKPTSAPLPGFRSSGIHVLEAYISPAPAAAAPRAAAGAHFAAADVRPGVCSSSGSAAGANEGPVLPGGGTASRRLVAGRAPVEVGSASGGPAGGDAAPASAGAVGSNGKGSTVWTGGIDADNVGFRLLRQAGWRVGTGLGAASQGRHEPVEPNAAKGTRGLGFDGAAAREQQRQQQAQAQAQGRKREAEGAPGGAAGGGGGTSSSQRIKRLVAEELAAEPLDAKVARHRSVMRAEAEQERGRAIERYLRNAFNDPFDALHSDNSNPLARRHALSSNNPLLDPIGD